MTREITFETTEQFSFLQSDKSQRPTFGWCRRCGCEVEMVTAEYAAQTAGVNVRAIFRCIEAGTLHCVEDGQYLWVCVPTLSAAKVSGSPASAPTENPNESNRHVPPDRSLPKERTT